jgi:hypothetical protein
MNLAQLGREKPKRDPKKKVRWQPPDEGMFKINTDASFHSHSMSGSVGLVVRYHLGTMIRSQALWFEHAASAPSMEAVVTLKEQGWHRRGVTYALSLRATLCWLSTFVTLTTTIGQN